MERVRSSRSARRVREVELGAGMVKVELSLVEGKGAVITLDQFNQLERSILNNNKCLDKVLILHDVCMERNAQDIKEENVLSLIR